MNGFNKTNKRMDTPKLPQVGLEPKGSINHSWMAQLPELLAALTTAQTAITSTLTHR